MTVMSLPLLQTARIDSSRQILQLDWSDQTSVRLHALWLRDNCQGDCCRHPGNGQRLHTVLDLPAAVELAAIDLTVPDTLSVQFGPDGHNSCFSTDWLYTQSCDSIPARESGWLADSIQVWDSRLQLARASYPVIRQDNTALADWLTAIVRDGVAVLTDCPLESGTVAQVASLFGYVRETNYGRWFDVRSELNPVNLAYTGLGLQVHTDNPYRDPTPGLQLLHCLANDAEGGDSVVVDGFRAAQQLQSENAADFALLSRYPIAFEYRAGKDWLRAETPMIELGANGELRAVHFNNRSIAPLSLPCEFMPDYYAAYRRFAEILARPELSVCFKLVPGELFIVDNRRVLHGRTAFSGTGSRHLQGCYTDHDGLASTLRMLRTSNSR